MSRYPRWTEKEKDILRELYKTLPAYEICKILGRPKGATILMASRLGLKADRTIHWTNTWRFLNANPYEKITEYERAYIAGIFDGEGCLEKMKGRSFWEFEIGNTHKGLIDWLGLKIEYSRTTTYQPKHQGWKRKWEVRLFGNRKIRALLQVLLPYLIVKQERALEAIADIEGQLQNV